MQFSPTVKQSVASLISMVLGRRNFARLARYLWMQSRLDLGYDITRNGELELLRAFATRSAGLNEVTVLDVGANMGQWASAMLTCMANLRGGCKGVHVHLFEPVPATHAILRAQAMGDGTACVKLNQVAIADAVGEGTMAIFDARAGIHTLRTMPADVPHKHVPVSITTIDNYVAAEGISRVDLLKIDTEGNDMNVLFGAKQALQSGTIQYVQFEYNHRWIPFRHFLKDAFDYLQPFGFQIGKITPMGVEVYPRWHPELESFREGNYLAWQELDLPIPTIPWWNESSP